MALTVPYAIKVSDLVTSHCADSLRLNLSCCHSTGISPHLTACPVPGTTEPEVDGGVPAPRQLRGLAPSIAVSLSVVPQ